MTYRKMIELTNDDDVFEEDTPKSREHFNCSDKTLYRFIAMIIRSALIDYMKPIPTKCSKYVQQRIKHDKMTAKLFFEKSKLFLTTGIDFEYLKANYQKIKDLGGDYE